MFEEVTIEINEQLSLHEQTRKRINLLLQREVLQKQVNRLTKEYLEAVIDNRTYYQELLDLLHETAEKVVGEHSEDLRYAAVELFRRALQECPFVSDPKRSDILDTIRFLILKEGGS